MRLLLGTGLLGAVLAFGFLGISSTSARASGKVKPMSYGACYSLYNCEGASIGTFDDQACRAYGGHSINSGGVCLNL